MSPAVDGVRVDTSQVAPVIAAALLDPATPASITLTADAIRLAPAIDNTDAERAQRAAQRIATALVLTRGDKTWKITATPDPLVDHVRGYRRDLRAAGGRGERAGGIQARRQGREAQADRGPLSPHEVGKHLRRERLDARAGARCRCDRQGGGRRPRRPRGGHGHDGAGQGQDDGGRPDAVDGRGDEARAAARHGGQLDDQLPIERPQRFLREHHRSRLGSSTGWSCGRARCSTSGTPSAR